MTVERFGSEMNLVLVSACFTRLPSKFIIALKYRVPLNSLNKAMLLNFCLKPSKVFPILKFLI